MDYEQVTEARERALCWLKHTQSKGWCRCVSADACLPTMREMFRDQVAATLAADRAAGYAIVPYDLIARALMCLPQQGSLHDELFGLLALRTACKEDNDAKRV